MARYQKGTIPETNVNFIALFSMNDFNFSDAIKNGTARQNDLTDELLGIDKSQRERGGETKRSLKKLDVTYDNNIKPDIENNFSLKNVKDGHYKQSFGVNDENYTSVTQFIDKSIMYASYVLRKEENFIPTYIVAAPSSSNFNDLYCQRLSSKMNIPYVKDFFKRNVINVRYDNNTDSEILRKNGFSESEIQNFETDVKKMAFTEISAIVSEPLKKFFVKHQNLFSKVSKEKYSREKINFFDVYKLIFNYALNYIVENLNDTVGE
jgi:hypothetical protein